MVQKGSGFLYVNEKVKIRPILFGGGQQDGMRSGTENVPAIAGLGVAVKEIYTGHLEKRAKLYELKKRLIAGLQDVDGVTINALIDPIEETAPHIVSVSFANTRSEVMLHALGPKWCFCIIGFGMFLESSGVERNFTGHRSKKRTARFHTAFQFFGHDNVRRD